nr:UPF0764 protein C16orf89 homolog isoform X1 [Caretta caretta]
MSFPVCLLLIFLFKSDLSKSEADMRSIIISALEKTTFFLANKYRDINLDAVLGFRVFARKDNGKSCIVTRACRNIMTKFGCSDYSLSHQLFYFMFADVKGCSDHLFLRAQYYKNIFCACMMKINLVIESTGFRFSSRDLFMENNENSEHPSRVKDQEQLLRRVKRREKVFADGCSFHNTATAVGVLGGFLYYY